METAVATIAFPAHEVEPLRRALELTQGQFAKRLGVTRTLVTHWEKGIRTPTGPAAILLIQMASQQNLEKISKRR